MYKSPPRGAHFVPPRWLPKAEATATKLLETTLEFTSVGMGTWVTKRIGFVGLAARGPSLKATTAMIVAIAALLPRKRLRISRMAPSAQPRCQDQLSHLIEFGPWNSPRCVLPGQNCPSRGHFGSAGGQKQFARESSKSN